VAVSLASKARGLQDLSGKLTRRDEKADSKFFAGTLNVVFAPSSKQRSLGTTAALENPDHLRLRFDKWPEYFDRRGNPVGEKFYSEDLTR
jgi:hypothetical protein